MSIPGKSSVAQGVSNSDIIHQARVQMKFGSPEFKAFMAKRKAASKPTTVGSNVPNVDTASPIVDASTLGDRNAGELSNGMAGEIRNAIPPTIWESSRLTVESADTATHEYVSPVLPSTTGLTPACSSAACVAAAVFPSTTKPVPGITRTAAHSVKTTPATDRPSVGNNATSSGWKPEGFRGGINSHEPAESPTTVYTIDDNLTLSLFRVYHTIDGCLPAPGGHRLAPRPSWGGGGPPSLRKNPVITTGPTQFMPSDELSDLGPPQRFHDMARDMGLISREEYTRRSAPPAVIHGVDPFRRPQPVEQRDSASRRVKPVEQHDDPLRHFAPVEPRNDVARCDGSVENRHDAPRLREPSRNAQRNGLEVNRREQPAHSHKFYRPRVLQYRPVHMRYASSYHALYNEHVHSPERELRDEMILRGLPIPSSYDLDDLIDALYSNDKAWRKELLNLEGEVLSKLWESHEVNSFIHDSMKSGHIDYLDFGDLQTELAIKEAPRLGEWKAAKKVRAKFEDTFDDMHPATLKMLRDIANAEGVVLNHGERSINEVAATIAEHRARKSATEDQTGRDSVPPYLHSRREDLAPIRESGSSSLEFWLDNPTIGETSGAKRPRVDDEQNQVAKRLRLAPLVAPVQQVSSSIKVDPSYLSTSTLEQSYSPLAASKIVSTTSQTATLDTSLSSQISVHMPFERTLKAKEETPASTKVLNGVNACDPDTLFAAALKRGNQAAAKKKERIAKARESREAKEKAAANKISPGVRSGRVKKTKSASSARRTVPTRPTLVKKKEAVDMKDFKDDRKVPARSSTEDAQDSKWIWVDETEDDFLGNFIDDEDDEPVRGKPKKTNRRRYSSTETAEGGQIVPRARVKRFVKD